MAKKIPGPPTLPLIGNLHQSSADVKRIISNNSALNRKYKGIFRLWIGPTQLAVFLSRPDHLKIALSSYKVLDRGALFRKLTKAWFRNSMLLTKNKKRWYEHRKLTSMTFSPKILENFISVFVKHSNILINVLLREKSNDQTPFDIWYYLMPTNFNIVCETILGVDTAEQEKVSMYLNATETLMSLFMKRLKFPILIFDMIYKFTPMYQEESTLIKNIFDFANEVIRKKEKKLSKKNVNELTEIDKVGNKKFSKAFLDFFMEIIKNEPNWTKQDLIDELNFIIVAAYDTTATSNCFILVELAMHQDIQDQVYEELQEVFGTSTREPTMEDISKLVYLEMVIKESLRKNTTLPYTPRYVEDDLDLGDYVIPKGTVIFLNSYDLHLNPEYWDEPEKFNPNRFHPEEIQKRNPNHFIPFGNYLRKCIGNKFAMLSVKVFMSSFLRKFKVTTPLKEDDLKLTINITLKLANGFMISLHPR